MKKKKNVNFNIKKVLKYIFLFIVILFYLNIIPFDLDEIWNYGFANGIYQGLVPYKDFNMVVTPFFPFFLSLFFKIFGSNALIVNIVQALLILLSYYLLEILFKEKANIILILLIGNYDLIYASYNYFIFVLFLIILVLETKNKNDYLIGVILGLAILTKQSIGICLFLPSLYYFFKDRNYKKILKRIVGAIIPISIFVLYLFITNSYNEFLDLCFFGLFDFGKSNYIGSKLVIFIVLLTMFIIIYSIKKEPQNIKKYYILSYSSITFPMFDSFHVKFFIIVFLFLFLEKIKFAKINYNLFLFGCLIGIFFISFVKELEKDFVYPNSINHFEYRYISREHIKETKQVIKKLNKYKNKKILSLFEQSYYYKIVMDEKITYFDLINTGNWGYNGSKKLQKALDENKDAIFVINRQSFTGSKQTDKTVLKYILKKGKLIDKIKGFEFYIIEN